MKNIRCLFSAILLCSLVFVFSFLSAGSESSGKTMLITSTQKSLLTAVANTVPFSAAAAETTEIQLKSAGLTEMRPAPADADAASSGTEATEKSDSVATTQNIDTVTGTIAAVLEAARDGKSHIFTGDFLLSPQTGTNTALAVARYGYPDDRASYLKALHTYVSKSYQNNDGPGDDLRALQQIALTVSALGGNPMAFGSDDNGYVINLLADAGYDCKAAFDRLSTAAGALLLLNADKTAVPDDAYAKPQTLVVYILSQQNSDGGFGADTTPKTSDPLSTAGILLALAPYAGDTTAYPAGMSPPKAIDKALTYLSQNQNGDGTFSNAFAATAKVVTALCSLGIDPSGDARFIKKSNSAYDGLLKFYEENGKGFSFPSQPEAGASQGFLALVAYDRFSKGNCALYDFGVEPASSDAELLSLTTLISTLPQDAGEKDETLINCAAILYNRLNDEDKASVSNGPKLEKLLAQLAYTKWGEISPHLDDLSEDGKALDDEIAAKIDPIKITLNDIGLVKGLCERYNALRYGDKIRMEHRDTLILAKKIIDGLENHLIIKDVFQLLMGKDIEYAITAAFDNGQSYTITFNGQNITAAQDFDLRLYPYAVNIDQIRFQAQNPFTLGFAQSGAFPGMAKIDMEAGLKDGSYYFYRYHADTESSQNLGEIQVSEGRFTFSTAVGGDYFLTAKQVKDNICYLRIADFPGGIVPATVFEEIQGQDIYLVLEGVTAATNAYTFTFYGKDIETPMAFNGNITTDSPFATAIGQWAKNPLIWHFYHDGPFPGFATFQYEGAALTDGIYWLYRYDENSQKPDFLEKIELSGGTVSFSLSSGGDYFLTAAKAEDTAGGTDATVSPGSGINGGTPAGEGTEGISSLWTILGSLLLLAGIFIFFRMLKNWQT